MRAFVINTCLLSVQKCRLQVSIPQKFPGEKVLFFLTDASRLLHWVLSIFVEWLKGGVFGGMNCAFLIKKRMRIAVGLKALEEPQRSVAVGVK